MAKKHGISESPRNAVAHRNVFCRSVFGNTAMAQAFRISERGVQRLAIYEGMPRKSRGECPYFECLSWFIAHLQKKFCRDCDEPIHAGPCRGSEAAARCQCQLSLSFVDVQCRMKHNRTSARCPVPDLLLRCKYRGTIFCKSLAEFEQNFETRQEERGQRASEISRVPEASLGVESLAPRGHSSPRKNGLGSNGVQHAGTPLQELDCSVPPATTID